MNDDSDFYWLVYSDWLEEHNQLDLANLIRAEVETVPAWGDGPPWDFNSSYSNTYNIVGGGQFGRIGGYLAIGGNQVGAIFTFVINSDPIGSNVGGYQQGVGGHYDPTLFHNDTIS